MIESLEGFPANVVAFACRGRVTKQEYDTVLIPAVTAALERQDKVRLYYQIDPDFTGIEPGAVWKDIRLGVEHLSRWERIAVVTDVGWIRNTFAAFAFLIPGETEIFPLADAEKARAWIAAEGAGAA